MDESPHSSIVSEREEQKCFPLQADSHREPPEVINWVPLLIAGLKGTKTHVSSLLPNVQHKHWWIFTRVLLGRPQPALPGGEGQCRPMQTGSGLPFCLGCLPGRFQYNRSSQGSWYWGGNNEGRTKQNTDLIWNKNLFRNLKGKLRNSKFTCFKRPQNFVSSLVETVCCTHWQQHQPFYFLNRWWWDH